MGFRQEQGIDFDETFASVVRSSIAKALLVLAAKYDYDIEQMDVRAHRTKWDYFCMSPSQSPIRSKTGP